MKIALMGRSLRPPLTGIGRYTVNLARSLSARVDPHDLSLYVTRDAGEAVSDLACRVVSAPVPTPHELMRGVWEQTLVAADVMRSKPDVYHSPNYALPLALRCPAVLTVHDLAYLDDRFHKARLRHYLRLFTGFSVRKATRIIAVSHFTRDRIIERYPEAAAKVSVVHNGLDPLYEKRPSEAHFQTLQQAIGLKDPYVLYVGTIEPRKNIPRLVQAFEAVAARAEAKLDLVICGAWGWRYEESRAAIENSPLRQRIRVTGYIPAAQLPALYAGARCLVYPSLEEGFGFPPLEAMAMGTPVIASNTSSLPEVVGDAGILVNPTDTATLARQLERVLIDNGLASELSARGLEQARLFSWDRAAEETLDVYREAMIAGGRS